MVLFVLFEFEGFNNVFDFHLEQVNNVGLIHECYDNLALPDLNLHNIGLEAHIGNNPLGVYR